MSRTWTVVAIYATLSLALGGQWIAAKLGVTAVPALELSTLRFAIASVVLLAACAISARRSRCAAGARSSRRPRVAASGSTPSRSSA